MYKPAFKLHGLLLLLMLSVAGMAQKTDKVFLKNGDIMTGEIKYMKFAKLLFDVTGPGKIEIKWEEVVKIRSDKIFQVTFQKGQVLITKLDSLFFEKEHISIDDIVYIVQIKSKFFKSISGDISLGFNYAKSTDIIQFNFGSTTTYRKPNLEINLKLSSVISDKSTDSILSKKQDANLDVMKQLKNHFYIKTDLGWQQNTELGLNNRVLFSAGSGKILVNDNHNRLLTGTGLSYNGEQSNQSSDYTNNLEALFLVEFKKFHYSTPKISIDAHYTLYPSLTNWGRLRMDVQLDAKIEIFKDFNVGLSFYDLYDNRPPGAASTNDFGVNFTIGYTFGK